MASRNETNNLDAALAGVSVWVQAQLAYRQKVGKR